MRYLWYQQQLTTPRRISPFCCELLSKWGIFDISNNRQPSRLKGILVVNCFQNEVSLISATTIAYIKIEYIALWIAFKMRYLWYQQQHPMLGTVYTTCCELLSKWGIFDISNNHSLMLIRLELVVNCFQNEVSLISATTLALHFQSIRLLWIAFKMRYLWYQQQPLPGK